MGISIAGETCPLEKMLTTTFADSAKTTAQNTTEKAAETMTRGFFQPSGSTLTKASTPICAPLLAPMEAPMNTAQTMT